LETNSGEAVMLGALTILLVFQLTGEVLAQLFALPIPGPVIGMALLFVALALRGGPSGALRDTAQNLLQHLSLLFVPAGVGVMLHFHRIGDEWLPLAASLVGSTVLTIAVTALVLRALSRRAETAGK
jgi:holin-like protein